MNHMLSLPAAVAIHAWMDSMQPLYFPNASLQEKERLMC
jgi:hypothetical protein